MFEWVAVPRTLAADVLVCVLMLSGMLYLYRVKYMTTLWPVVVVPIYLIAAIAWQLTR